MKCAECKIIRMKPLDKMLKREKTWQRHQLFGKYSGEDKGKIDFCSDKCKEMFLLKNNYSLD